MTFLFDNNLPPKLVQILRILDVDARHLRCEFGPDSPDEVWIPASGQRRWVIVTQDLGIRRRGRPERIALEQANTVAIFIRGAVNAYGLWQKTEWFLKRWSAIEEAVADASPGTNLTVPTRGKITS